MTVDTMSVAVSLLTSGGFHATVEYPGTINVSTGESELFVFGTANPMFGCDIYKTYRDDTSSPDDSMDTDISSECDDPVLIAETIAKTIYPEGQHSFVCAYCRNILNPGDHVVWHQDAETNIDVFCSDACKHEAIEDENEMPPAQWATEPGITLSVTARQIFDAVIRAMQDAEEIWGPGDAAYVPLMEAIAAEANQRITNFRKMKEQTK